MCHKKSVWATESHSWDNVCCVVPLHIFPIAVLFSLLHISVVFDSFFFFIYRMTHWMIWNISISIFCCCLLVQTKKIFIKLPTHWIIIISVNALHFVRFLFSYQSIVTSEFSNPIWKYFMLCAMQHCIQLSECDDGIFAFYRKIMQWNERTHRVLEANRH